MAAQLVQTRHNKWLAVLLMKWMGYSSFAAAIVSIIVYCYKKQMAIKQVIKKPVDGLHMKRKPLEITIARSTSSLANLHASTQLLTPPPSPQPATAANKSWSTRLIDGVISVTRKRKRMTISLKNTILWNPSSDFNTPNHAFHENTVTLLNKLTHVYDIYVIIQLNSDQERHQITQLLNNANLLLDSRKILYCSTEQGKLHLIRHIQPQIHVEGGCESDDGSFIINGLNVEQKIWIKKNPPLMNDEKLQMTDSILKTWIAAAL